MPSAATSKAALIAQGRQTRAAIATLSTVWKKTLYAALGDR
jgi:hypothetical protein